MFTRKNRMNSQLRLEALEDRVVLSWGSIPPRTIALPSNVSSVTLNSNNAAEGQAVITTTENDFYTFVASVTGKYTLRALTPSSSLDTVLGVYSASGSRLAYNDDISATNRDSTTSLNLTAGSRYYFGITNYIRTPGGAYTWQVEGPSTAPTPPTDDSYEDNDSLASASYLGVLTSTKTINNLVMADAADVYRFTTNATGTTSSTVSIAFQNSQGNLNLELYNSAGQRLAVSTGLGNSEAISLNGLAASNYYVRVYGNQGAFNPSYSLTINPPAPVPPPTSGGFNIQIAFTGGLTAGQQAIFEQAAARWEQIIIGDLPNATYRGTVVDDVLISASSVNIDGVGNVLGQAGPDAFRSGTFLPYHGVMEFDTADLADLERSGQLVEVIMHEMGHVLGIGTIWEDRGLLSGSGSSNPLFTGANAVAAYNQIFGVNATGVPVENSGGSGTRDSHWRESVFGAELMTGYINSGVANPISRVTVASLADLGYQVNYNAADAYTPPSGGFLRALSSSSGAGNGQRLVSPTSVPISNPQGAISNGEQPEQLSFAPSAGLSFNQTMFLVGRVSRRESAFGWSTMVTNSGENLSEVNR